MMQRYIPPEAERYTQQNNRRRIWRKFVQMMACAVVFCTTYALILPAITMEKPISCEIEEHKHTESCYVSVDSEQIQKLACTYASLGVHVHTEECRGDDGQFICGYADYLIHQHGTLCSSDGILLCQIPEIEEHEHSESCYREVPVDAELQDHNHDASCYTNKRGDLICQIGETEGHRHSEECYTLSDTLVCGLEEKTGHTHSEACTQTVQVCGLVTEPHEHDTSACYQQLTCELPEDETHTHSEACTGSVLNCTLTEQPHNHTESCYQINYVCGLVEEDGHAHTDACRESVLSCGLEEAEGHQHTDSCYVQEQVLICQPEETKTELELICDKDVIKLHSHEDACYEIYLDETGAQQQRLICEETVVLEHNHETSCYTVEEVPLENAQTLTCQLTEGHIHAEGCYDETQQLICTEVENHIHGTLCYGTWELICGKEEHSHTELCRALSEEEQIQVDTVIAQISALPTADEADAHLLELEEAQDMETYEAYFTEVGQDGRKAYEAYEALNEVQKTRVTNLDKLMELSYIWSIAALPDNTLQLGEIPDCSCTNGESAIGAHADGCEKKKFFKTLAEERTAEELYSVWQEITEDARAYILDYLSWNYQYNDKLIALKDLISNGSGGIKEELDGTTFEITGTLPDNADLVVADAEYEEEKTFSFLNPNMWADVNQYWVYDIEIQVDQQSYQPEEAVTVTVTSPEFVVTEDEYFCVAHLDAENNEIISSTYVDVVDNSITFEATGFSPYLFYTVDKDIDGGERIWGTNWMKRRDSGFATYWEQFLGADIGTASYGTPESYALANLDEPSDRQVKAEGGSKRNSTGTVTISKTIDGTDIENVFDITLTVSTEEKITEIIEEPDMAVVIVMDISNTMNADFGDKTRYEAAMLSAEAFLDNFSKEAGSVSRIGYVAFNTDAHKIFDLSQCSTEGQADQLKNTMRQKTAPIINDSGYADSHKRFTNVEAGLKMGGDMLANATNKNKYIIFLSDGFPTTYVNYNYVGYDPYTESGTPGVDGVFYDYVAGVHCDYGTSYSDKAAIRARQMATDIKNQGVSIFSIGVDVAGQTIQKYLPAAGASFSVVDRTSTTYEIGDASSTEAYKSWLKTGIGSNYYYDSTDSGGLQAAYDAIFEEIRRINQEASAADWVAEDPMPIVNDVNYVEFIGFFNQNGNLVNSNLTGSPVEGGEDTATYTSSDTTINWDLKDSGYSKSTSGDVTTYYYELVYRVRLKNETKTFEEGTIYDTNGETTLTYKTIENGVIVDQEDLKYPIPSVHGYLSELIFKKVDPYGRAVVGAEFTLTHDTAVCSVCRGNGTTVAEVKTMVATSDANGQVSFSGIPSGHIYKLEETKVPEGYASNGYMYSLKVAYDQLIMTVTDQHGNRVPWDYTITNITSYELPNTGGAGTHMYTLAGLVLMLFSAAYLLYKSKARRREVS